ncbi:hypothetical protein VTH82DRAFT_7894 [Thermothelomyces myriococcoides]
MAPLRLRHLHLPSIHPDYIPYSLASRVQEFLRRQHLDFKDGSSTREPPPTLISFTPSPIYTLGRRQTTPLAPSEAARLTAPLHIPSPFSSSSDAGGGGGGDSGGGSVSIRPRLVHSLRGGLTTYHGPGQIVLWPVLDLRSPHHRNYTVKCYARLLETTTIATLHALFGIRAFTTDDPGVWVTRSPSSPGEDDQDHPASAATTTGASTLAKIAALGVHLRRHVTALGTAINVAMPELHPEMTTTKEVGSAGESTNPWARFVPCGLEGHGVTCISGQIQQQQQQQSPAPTASSSSGGGGGGGGVERKVADAWAEELAERLGLGLDESGSADGGSSRVEVVGEEEALRLMEELVSSGRSAGMEDGEELEVEREYVLRMRRALCGR